MHEISRIWGEEVNVFLKIFNPIGEKINRVLARAF
jgi:hypothetical protein